MPMFAISQPQCAYFSGLEKAQPIIAIKSSLLPFMPCGTQLLDSRKKSDEAISRRK